MQEYFKHVGSVVVSSVMHISHPNVEHCHGQSYNHGANQYWIHIDLDAETNLIII